MSINPFNINEVPYISTYYIKPIVTTNEDVILNYYVTDFYHKEYLNEDTSETFTVTITISGYPTIIKRNILAGDNSINLGKFKNLGEQKFSILCTDRYGKNSHELFNFFLVKNELPIKEYIMTTNDLIEYNIDNTDNTKKVSTNRDGLQKLIVSKNTLGFNKLKLLPGIYTVDHLGTLYIPSNFTLDMNSSTIKLDGFAGDKALIIDLMNTFDSHVINGTIEGDYLNHDYAHSKNNSEWVNGIRITGESKYSSFENLVIKNIAGCGASIGLNNSLDENLECTYLPPQAIGNTFKLGGINRLTGTDISSANRTTCDFREISGYSDIGYLSISRYLGDQGNACESFNLICHFYDLNKIFIKSTDSYQYRKVLVPPTSKFVRVTLLSLSYPTDLSIQLFKIPTHCAFKNIEFHNCRCGGMSQGATKDMLIEGCKFSSCAQIPSKFTYYAQHGLDLMQDITFKELNFYSNHNNDFLACAGHNFVVDGQIEGNLSILERVRSLVVKNCKNISINLQGGGISTILNHGIYRIYNNEFTDGTVANNLSKKNKCTGFLGGIVSYSTLSVLATNSIYNKCTININTINLGSINKISMTDCDFIPEKDFTNRYILSFNGGHLNDNYFKNCAFKGKSSLSNNNGFYSGQFLSCAFEDTIIFPNVLANKDDLILFDSCNLAYSSYNFIYYYDKREGPSIDHQRGSSVENLRDDLVENQEFPPIDKEIDIFTNIQFDKCKIKNIGPDNSRLIYIYSKIKGLCIFNSCTIIKNIKYIYFSYNPLNYDPDKNEFEIKGIYIYLQLKQQSDQWLEKTKRKI